MPTTLPRLRRLLLLRWLLNSPRFELAWLARVRAPSGFVLVSNHLLELVDRMEDMSC